MGGMILLGDASRRPVHFPVVTALIILVNGFVVFLELMCGDAFVTTWSTIPADVVAGQGWITILTAMFMHESWLHIIGNMVFLWAFGLEIEDAMNPFRYLLFYLVGGMVAMLAQIAASPDSTVPYLGASGAIAAVIGAFLVTYPRDEISHPSVFLLLCACRLHPGRAFNRVLVPHAAFQCWRGGDRADGRGGVPGSHRRLPLWDCHRATL
jgi:membrane associated rhomboid family serine protease